jgi:hypothetical protein
MVNVLSILVQRWDNETCQSHLRREGEDNSGNEPNWYSLYPYMEGHKKTPCTTIKY